MGLLRFGFRFGPLSDQIGWMFGVYAGVRSSVLGADEPVIE